MKIFSKNIGTYHCRSNEIVRIFLFLVKFHCISLIHTVEAKINGDIFLIQMQEKISGIQLCLFRLIEYFNIIFLEL